MGIGNGSMDERTIRAIVAVIALRLDFTTVCGCFAGHACGGAKAAHFQ
jgi:hypothetical protein